MCPELIEREYDAFVAQIATHLYHVHVNVLLG